MNKQQLTTLAVILLLLPNLLFVKSQEFPNGTLDNSTIPSNTTDNTTIPITNTTDNTTIGTNETSIDNSTALTNQTLNQTEPPLVNLTETNSTTNTTSNLTEPLNSTDNSTANSTAPLNSTNTTDLNSTLVNSTELNTTTNGTATNTSATNLTQNASTNATCNNEFCKANTFIDMNCLISPIMATNLNYCSFLSNQEICCDQASLDSLSQKFEKILQNLTTFAINVDSKINVTRYSQNMSKNDVKTINDNFQLLINKLNEQSNSTTNATTTNLTNTTLPISNETINSTIVNTTTPISNETANSTIVNTTTPISNETTNSTIVNTTTPILNDTSNSTNGSLRRRFLQVDPPIIGTQDNTTLNATDNSTLNTTTVPDNSTLNTTIAPDNSTLNSTASNLTTTNSTLDNGTLSNITSNATNTTLPSNTSTTVNKNAEAKSLFEQVIDLPSLNISEIILNLPIGDIQPQLENYQAKRKKCFDYILQLASSFSCMACFSEQKQAEFYSNHQLTLDISVCTSLEENCGDYIIASNNISVIVDYEGSLQTIYSSISKLNTIFQDAVQLLSTDFLNDSVTQFANQIKESYDELSNLVTNTTFNVSNTVSEEECSGSDSCQYTCQNFISVQRGCIDFRAVEHIDIMAQRLLQMQSTDLTANATNSTSNVTNSSISTNSSSNATTSSSNGSVSYQQNAFNPISSASSGLTKSQLSFPTDPANIATSITGSGSNEHPITTQFAAHLSLDKFFGLILICLIFLIHL